MTLSELRQIRDHAEFILRGYINMGDEHLVGYEDNAEFLHALPAPSVLKREKTIKRQTSTASFGDSPKSKTIATPAS